MTKIIAFLAYESPWFPGGGIAAVMGQLPKATRDAALLPTVVITPFHVKSARIQSLGAKSVGAVDVPYDRGSVRASVFCSEQGVPWYFVKVEAREMETPFSGERHPYDVPSQMLMRDSLLFGAVAVRSLPVVAKHLGVESQSAEWNLIAQDWECATALLAFASAGTALRGRLHLTLHNSYDAFATAGDFFRVGIDSARCPGDTILDRALALVEPPAFTVSEQFASDFTDDLLQREIIAPQLQQALRRRPVVGVDNGPFKALALDEGDLREAALGNFERLHAWKEARRQRALAELDAHRASKDQPFWGDKTRFRRDGSPWFVMAGRDDPRQKGYDVAAAAVEDYLTASRDERDRAQFLFFPMPGDEGLRGLGFLESLASRHPDDVLVFPFIWVAGFTAALQGAAYGLMPSLYEPFGMANEFYLAGGCVGIGRATGGNLEQIVPLRAASACSRAVLNRSARFHPLSAHPTGILFREKDEIASARGDWQAINDGRYDRGGGSPSRVEERRRYRVFWEMADELGAAIRDGIGVWVGDRALYYRMLAEGIAHIQRTFSWRRAGQEYARKVAGG